MDQATRVAWSTAGLGRSSPRLPFVLGSLCDVGFEVNSSKPYQGLPALTRFLQRERVALGTLFFPPPVLRLSGDAGEISGKLARDTLGRSKAEWEYVPTPRRVLGKSVLSLFCRATGGPKIGRLVEGEGRGSSHPRPPEPACRSGVGLSADRRRPDPVQVDFWRHIFFYIF